MAPLLTLALRKPSSSVVEAAGKSGSGIVIDEGWAWRKEQNHVIGDWCSEIFLSSNSCPAEGTKSPPSIDVEVAGVVETECFDDIGWYSDARVCPFCIQLRNSVASLLLAYMHFSWFFLFRLVSMLGSATISLSSIHHG